MAEEKDSGEKQHEPTRKRLEDARRKGEIAKSTDLSTAATYAGILLVGMSIGGASLERVVNQLAWAMGQPQTLGGPGLPTMGGTIPIGFMSTLAVNLMPWFAVPMLAAILTIVAQRGFVFTPEKLKPKLNRISPLATARNKFGRSGLFEFAKSFAKLLIYSVILGVFLWRQLPEMIRLIASEPRMIPAGIFDISLSFLVIVFLVSVSIGALDYIWQRQEHIRKNRMSHKEMTDEVKHSEGDPHVKNQRRQRGYDIAMNQMLAEVPKSDVVLVNPTHYAVALKWDRSPGAAPVCVAKGADEIAARIREIASEAGVPIHHNPEITRAIFASVDIGREIQPAHYEAVAAAIRFAEDMRQKAKRAFGK